MWQEFVLGFMASTWVFTVGGVAYTVWRYVKKPWAVMRKDVVALNDLLLQEAKAREELQLWVKNEFGLRRAIEVTPDMEARAEAKMNARRTWGLPPEGSR